MATRKSILFVDDEQEVRASLQRLLRPFSAEWDLTFVASAEEALARLAASKTNVVVTDVVMPGMGGAGLLQEISTRFPEVARIILAAPADHPRVMECAMYAHQFIIRPCRAEVLHEAIRRACNMEESVRRERITRLVERMDRMPSLPSLYLELVEKIQDPESDAEDIGAIIARDIGMTARILKLVNSAFFGLRRRVSSPQEAVNFVGIDTVKALVLSIGAFTQFEKPPLGGVALESLWSHCLMTAGIAKSIAQSEDTDARMIDEAFVSGILHDVGKLALGANFAVQYAEVMATAGESSEALLTAENSAFGADHAEIGGHLLGMWGLPVAVVDAVTWHHNPTGCPDRAFGPLACVHVANAWAHAGEPGGRRTIAMDYYRSLDCADRVDAWHHNLMHAHGERVSA